MEVSAGPSLKSQPHELLAGAACPVRPGADLPSLRTSQAASPSRRRPCPPHSEAVEEPAESPSTAIRAALLHNSLQLGTCCCFPWHLLQLTTSLPSLHVPPAASSPLSLHGMEEQGLALD